MAAKAVRNSLKKLSQGLFSVGFKADRSASMEKEKAFVQQIAGDAVWDIVIVTSTLGFYQGEKITNDCNALGIGAYHLHGNSDRQGIKSRVFLVFITDQSLADPTVQNVVRSYGKFNGTTNGEEPPKFMLMYEPLEVRNGKVDPATGSIDTVALLAQAPEDLQTVFQDNEPIPYLREGSLANARMKMIFGLCDVKPTPLPPIRFDRYEIPMIKANQFIRGTRKWLLTEIEEWCNSSTSSNVFFIVGDAGVGKSCFLARMCALGNHCLSRLVFGSKVPADSVPVAAFHFFHGGEKQCTSSRAAIYSIAHQLCSSIPGFLEALKKSIGKNQNMYRLTDTELLMLLIVTPAQTIESPPSKRYVVVIDALDECDAAYRPHFTHDIQTIWGNPEKVPRWLSLVVSTRNDSYATHMVRGFASSNLTIDNPKHSLDLVTIIKARLEKCGVLIKDTMDKMTAKIEAHAHGETLYVALILRRLEALRQQSVTLQTSHVDSIPDGTAGIYNEFFAQLQTILNGDHEAYSAFLAPVLVARGPLPIAVWRHAALSPYREDRPLLTEDQFNKLIAQARSLFIVSNETVHVVHRSMYSHIMDDDADNKLSLLKTSGRTNLSVDPVIGHVLLGTACDARVGELIDPNGLYFEQMLGLAPIPPEPLRDKYCLSHCFYHLTMAENFVRAREQVLDYPRLFSRILHTGPISSQSGLQEMIRDLSFSLKIRKDHPLEIIKRALELSSEATATKPRELTSQLLGRIDPIHSSDTGDLFRFLQAAGTFGVGPGVWWWAPLRSELIKPDDNSCSVIESHNDSVIHDMKMSHDSSLLVVSHEENVARVYNAVDGAFIVSLNGHSGAVNCANFSPDDQVIVTGSADGKIKIWNPRSGLCLQTLEGGHSGPILSLCFSPSQNKILLTSSADKTCKLWSLETGQVVSNLVGHTDRVTSASFSQDGKYILTASDDSTSMVYDSSTGDVRAILRGHADKVRSAEFSKKNPRIVLTAGDDYKGKLWSWEECEGDRKNAKNLHTFKLGSSIGASSRLDLNAFASFALSAPCARFSCDPEESLIATTTMDGKIKLWSNKEGEDRENALFTLDEGHTAEVNSIAFSPNAGEGVLLSASSDKTLVLWSTVTGKQITALHGHIGPVNSAAYSTSGTAIMSFSRDHTARIWNTNVGQIKIRTTGHLDMVTSTIFSSDAKRIVTSSDDLSVRVWNAMTGQLINAIQPLDDLNSAGFTVDGEYIIAQFYFGPKRFWNSNTFVEATKPPKEDAITNVTSDISLDAQTIYGGELIQGYTSKQEVTYFGNQILYISKFGRRLYREELVTGFSCDGEISQARVCSSVHQDQICALIENHKVYILQLVKS